MVVVAKTVLVSNVVELLTRSNVKYVMRLPNALETIWIMPERG